MPALTQHFKRYTYPYDTAQAMTGTLPGMPSQSLSQPGGTVAMPRQQPLYQPDIKAPVIEAGQPVIPGQAQMPRAMPAYGPQLTGVLGQLQQQGLVQFAPTSMPSPYEEEYRQGARGWETLRGTLAQEAMGMSSPQAWAHAGLPGSYWAGQSDVRLGQIQQQVAGKRADIDARFRAKMINSAQRDVEIERLERWEAEQRAQAVASTEAARRQEGQAAATQRAGLATSLYGQVPVAPAPQPTGLSMLDSTQGNAQFISGRGGGAQTDLGRAVADLQAMGYSNYESLTPELKKWVDTIRNPAA